jgi:hypothetical protein
MTHPQAPGNVEVCLPFLVALPPVPLNVHEAHPHPSANGHRSLFTTRKTAVLVLDDPAQSTLKATHPFLLLVLPAIRRVPPEQGTDKRSKSAVRVGTEPWVIYPWGLKTPTGSARPGLLTEVLRQLQQTS